jgi:hypothetical protein
MNPLVGQPIVDLLKLRERYMRVLAGEEMEQVNSGGLGSIRHRMSHDDAQKGLASVMEALQDADPTKYGYRITRTVGDHRYSTHR